MLPQRLKNNSRVFAAIMVEGEKRGRPDRKLTNRNTHPKEQNEERGDAERDWVDVMFESFAADEERSKEIYGKYYTKKSRNFVIESVVDALGDMQRGCVPIPSLEPGGGRIHVELDRKQQADIDMIRWGFKAVAYEHLHGGYQASLHEHFRHNLNFDTAYFPIKDYGFDPISRPMGKEVKLKTDTPLDEFRREFTDRFELTYEQAKAVQKIAKKVNLSYDPGGREMTPENIAKRTFYGKDYVNRPIR